MPTNFSSPKSPDVAPPRPNILLVMTDQQRVDTINALGGSIGARTPVMDELVKRGAAFTHCCCTAPICTPSRASIMTGRYPIEVGMPDNLHAPSPPLSRAHSTIGDLMQAQGYETVYHGKWHLGGDIRGYGFERAEGCSYDSDTTRLAARYWRDRDWLEYHRPFFHVVSYLDPHDHYFYDPEETEEGLRRPWKNIGEAAGDLPPLPASKQVDWSEARWSAYLRFYRQRVERVDAEIGRLLEELRCSGFYNNTWIILCSDHGDMTGEHDIPFKGPFMYDGVLRVPLIIVPPQRRFAGMDRTGQFEHSLRPSRHEGLCSLLDVPATILDLAGAKRPENWGGVSLLPWVREERFDSPHDRIFSSWNTPSVWCVRSEECKYVRYADGAEELFDLKSDPGETRNLADHKASAAVLETMRRHMNEHIARVSPRAPTSSISG